MTKEEEAEFLAKRVEALKKMNPLSPEEFDDEVDELTWQWGRHLLPYLSKRRQNLASYKRRTILRQREFFDTLRLFKPMVMKYPTLAKRMQFRDTPDLENKTYEVNTEWIANEEKIAGFTYEDWVSETSSNTFDKWEMPAVGDLVCGKVVAMTKDGAFVEVGGKTWAFMPKRSVSLAPIGNVKEVLTMGEEIEAKVVAIGAESQISSDPTATQIILSMTELQSLSAWDEIDDIMRGVEGTDPILKVTVKAMRNWGAIVMTTKGLEGIIPNSQLADKVGDVTLVGEQIPVEIMSARRDLFEEIKIPLRPSDYALTFSYQNAATKVLAETLKEGEVVPATVVMIRDANLDIEVNGIRCTMRKIDITAAPPAFDISSVFSVGEEIKVYVISTLEKNGAIRLSTRALEFKRGAMLDDKAGVFENAEETAKLYFERAQVEKEKAAEQFAKILGVEDSEDADLPPKKSGSIDLDDDEDLGAGF